MWSLVVIVVLAAGWALSRPTNSSEPPLRRISVTASTPPPAAELAPVQQAPSSTVPEAPQVAPSAPQPQVAREHTRTSSTKPSIDTHAVDPVSAKPQAAELRTVYSERPVDRSAPMPQQRRTQAQTPAQDAPSGATQEPSGDLLPNPYKQ
jgi:hypothetical protein